jgi:hypothetical protein
MLYADSTVFHSSSYPVPSFPYTDLGCWSSSEKISHSQSTNVEGGNGHELQLVQDSTGLTGNAKIELLESGSFHNQLPHTAQTSCLVLGSLAVVAIS